MPNQSDQSKFRLLIGPNCLAEIQSIVRQLVQPTPISNRQQNNNNKIIYHLKKKKNELRMWSYQIGQCVNIAMLTDDCSMYFGS